MNSMPVALANHASAAGGDGFIFVLGGADNSGNTNQDVYAYAPSTSAWRQAATMPDAIEGVPAVAVVGCNLYVLGDNGLQIFNQSSNSWSQGATPLLPRVNAGAVGAGGRAYFFGGEPFGSDGDTSNADVFDPTAGTWSSLPEMPGGTDGLGAGIGSDGRLYAVGDIAQAFDLGTNTWTIVASPSVPRYWAGATNDCAGRLYELGGDVAGSDALGESEAAEAFDPKQGTWTTLARLPIPVASAPASTGADCRTYLFGGDSDRGYLSLVQVYDPVQDSWQILQ
jgi:non-specific serine/threonine protein kinase